jgi:hypothetical protein
MNLIRPRPGKPHPKAKFSLVDLMSGRFNPHEALATAGFSPYEMPDKTINIFVENYTRQIQTGGGAYIEGDVNMGGGKFVGRNDN